ncbi:hypothetical protein CLOP_g9381 [Closterium sp. NIES-67]|nr:hypothetical protein CLOP_g9381 [Closterium sp. NIES-67]
MVHAQMLRASQVRFLQDCQAAWNRTFNGWSGPNPNCLAAEGIQCDSIGMITHIDLLGKKLQGPIPNSISNLRELVYLYA